MANAKKKEEQAKRERVRKAQAELAAALQDLLPEGSFAEREQAIIDITTEVQKEITERELQSLADGVADEVKSKVRRTSDTRQGRYSTTAWRGHSSSRGARTERSGYGTAQPSYRSS